jgi:hypothetical protein
MGGCGRPAGRPVSVLNLPQEVRVMAAQGFVAVVGARVLPEAVAAQVSEVVGFFVSRGWGIGSGGARGADAYALSAVIGAGGGACARSVVFLPGAARRSDPALGAFAAQGGRVVPGVGRGRVALLARSRRLAREAAGVVAFLWGPSRGSVFTVREAVRAGKPAAVVLAGGGAVLPAFARGRWAPCQLGGVAAFRWVPAPGGPAAPPHSWLGRVFLVPEGEPTHGQLEHIASLSPGERLWFERAVLAGDTVLVAHEALSDTPAFLATRRLMRRFGCGVRQAAALGELFLALEAGPGVVIHYEAEARRLGVEPVVADLVHLIARLALVEAVPESDALERADRLGDDVDRVDDAGGVAQPAVLAAEGSASPAVQWHALGTVHVPRVSCPVCRATYEADDDAAELPTCPTCGARDTWEARQGPRFRGIVGAIDTCPSLGELSALGKRLYGLQLTADQASVAWSHYRCRKAALEAALALGAPARGLVARIGAAPAATLPQLGARLYRLQHAGSVSVSRVEWRRIWSAYQARRTASA